MKINEYLLYLLVMILTIIFNSLLISIFNIKSQLEILIGYTILYWSLILVFERESKIRGWLK